MTKQSVIDVIKEGRDLPEGAVSDFITDLINGKTDFEFACNFLTALADKGETEQEIYEAALSLRENCRKIKLTSKRILDTCGTGGDGLSTVNVSTAASLVAAAAGITVAKHGNRAVSSSSGSADFLSELGISNAIDPSAVQKGIDEIGFGFLFAPLYHPGMKHAAPVRQALKRRTIFNCLGPLANPAFATHQLTGVFRADLVPIFARILNRFGCKKAVVVHAEGGCDEVAISSTTNVGVYDDAGYSEFVFDPREYGYSFIDEASLKCQSAEESVRYTMKALAGQKSDIYNFIVLNAGFALFAAEECATIKDSLDKAADLIDDGTVIRKINEIKTYYADFKQ